MSVEIRAAVAEDIGQISELIGDRIGEEDAAEAELVLSDEFFRNRWFVAVEDENILSCAGVFPGQLHCGEVSVGAGAIEFVATREDAEGRGLVRQLMDRIHETAPERGEMVQWIVGITYFYRRFGYEYAIPVEGSIEIAAGASPPTPPGWSVDPLSAAEVPDLAKAQSAAARQADVALAPTRRMWDVYHRSPVYELIVAHSKGGHGYGRIYDYEGDRYLFDVVAETKDAAAALINAASNDGQSELTVMPRHSARNQLAAFGDTEPSGDAYYVRVADPVALLEAIRPILSKRLAAYDRTATGEGLISLYQSSIRFDYADGKVGPMRRGPAEQAPISKGGSGVAPDRIVSLLVGPLGAERLAELNPDVNLGEQEDLMKALFPPQTVDVHSWVVP